MIKTAKKSFIIMLALFLSACSVSGWDSEEGSLATATPEPTAGEPVKIGEPYIINGQWYYPKEQPNYDEVGMASWYGPQFHNKPTANGETFDMNKVTAAHKTLPLPSYVRVTNLANSRSLIVRINDRGPYADDRIIDLSRRTAQLLGFHEQGLQKVRVQLVNADGSLPKNQTPPKTVQDMTVQDIETSKPGFFVQVGSFRVKKSAENIAEELRQIGPVVITEVSIHSGAVYRVRLGPFDDELQAKKALKTVLAHDFEGARVFSGHAKS